MIRKTLIILVFGFFVFFEKIKSMEKNSNFYYSLEGKLVCEKVEGLSGLNFLYKNFFGKAFRFLLKNRYAAKAYAWYQDSYLSKRKINPFIKKHNIDMSKFVIPDGGFKSFNDFFVRKLKPYSRKIDLNFSTVVSPADSKLFVVENISKEVDFFVKNKKFNLYSFLRNDDLAKKYEGGTLLLFRLAPYDYHRYHFPVDCFSAKPRKINGSFESVNPIAYRSGIQPLIENERELFSLKAEKFGDVTMVSVGAMFVGRMVQTFTPEKNYKKGDEAGFFKFGGSSIVLLFEKNKIDVNREYILHSNEGYESEVKMGRFIATLKGES